MSEVTYIIFSILSFIPAIVCHEVMHGVAAYKLGDPTAKRQGRLSLNPLKHIDPFGTVILPLILMVMHLPVFGYAKPVPYNPSYFKDPRKGDLIVGLAGPLTNFALALVAAAVAWLVYPLVLSTGATNEFLVGLYYFLSMFALINLYFMFFNLLPIPPLDGSSIFAVILPRKYLEQYYKIQRYALPVFFAVIILLPYLIQMVSGVYFNPVSAYLSVTAGNIFNLIFP